MATDIKLPPIAENRRHQIFPTLNEAQFNLLMHYGELCQYKAGDVLFTEGERHISMYVILSGRIDIIRNGYKGPHVIASHGPGVFTGEVGTLAGRAAIATGCVAEDCEVIVINESSLRTLVVSEADLSETIMRAFILRRVAFIADENGGVMLIGSQASAATLRLREFLSRNAHPVAYFDVVSHPEEAKSLLDKYGMNVEDIPFVINAQSKAIVNPTTRELADLIGLSPDSLDGKQYDVVVVGAGPAGLASAVYAASEGLNVIVLDSKAPGGQAGSSSKIENYFGFPTGISGQALAGRGISQARKFGADVAVPIEVKRLECNAEKSFDILLDNGEQITARSVVIATGARYRKPLLEKIEQFEGRGIYYGASFMEANICSKQEVVVNGGGNSAGQAAVFLAGHASHVHIIVRGPGLAASMSHYLIQRIEAAPNITLHTNTEIVELIGDTNLNSIKWNENDRVEEVPISHVFLFLGAEPNTAWLGECINLDKNGFVLTGHDAADADWPLERAPYFLETSRPGIFAVGDVRSASVKRVAAAVGEGSAAIQTLHAYLASH